MIFIKFNEGALRLNKVSAHPHYDSLERLSIINQFIVRLL